MLARHPPTPPPYESLPFKPLSLFRHADILLSVRPSVRSFVRTYVRFSRRSSDRRREKMSCETMENPIARGRPFDRSSMENTGQGRGVRANGFTRSAYSRSVGRSPPLDAYASWKKGRRAIICAQHRCHVIVVAVVPVVIAISRYDNSTFSARLYLLPSPDPGCASRRSVYGARREGDSRRLDET